MAIVGLPLNNSHLDKRKLQGEDMEVYITPPTLNGQSHAQVYSFGCSSRCSNIFSTLEALREHQLQCKELRALPPENCPDFQNVAGVQSLFLSMFGLHKTGDNNHNQRNSSKKCGKGRLHSNTETDVSAASLLRRHPNNHNCENSVSHDHRYTISSDGKTVEGRKELANFDSSSSCGRAIMELLNLPEVLDEEDGLGLVQNYEQYCQLGPPVENEIDVDFSVTYNEIDVDYPVTYKGLEQTVGTYTHTYKFTKKDRENWLKSCRSTYSLNKNSRLLKKQVSMQKPTVRLERLTADDILESLCPRLERSGSDCLKSCSVKLPNLYKKIIGAIPYAGIDNGYNIWVKDQQQPVRIQIEAANMIKSSERGGLEDLERAGIHRVPAWKHLSPFGNKLSPLRRMNMPTATKTVHMYQASQRKYFAKRSLDILKQEISRMNRKHEEARDREVNYTASLIKQGLIIPQPPPPAKETLPQQTFRLDCRICHCFYRVPQAGADTCVQRHISFRHKESLVRVTRKCAVVEDTHRSAVTGGDTHRPAVTGVILESEESDASLRNNYLSKSQKSFVTPCPLSPLQNNMNRCMNLQCLASKNS